MNKTISAGKTCSRCKEMKPMSEYYAENRAIDGKCSECKECKSVDVRKWRDKNPNFQRDYYKEWRKANKRKRHNDWKLWCKKNPDKLKAQTKRKDAKRNADISWKLGNRISCGIRRSIKKQKGGRHWDKGTNNQGWKVN